ncbi:MAG: hypothetical protein MJ179_11755, partial [Treponema sp.]|nr:hypothetical protein [Treponema sp.]
TVTSSLKSTFKGIPEISKAFLLGILVTMASDKTEPSFLKTETSYLKEASLNEIEGNAVLAEGFSCGK